jgi:hypothetical protein
MSSTATNASTYREVTEAPARGSLKNHPALAASNINFEPGSGKIGLPLMVVGGVLLLVTLFAGFMGLGGVSLKLALGSYHFATMSILAITLGATFFTMVFHLTNAGWTATLRRQFENVMSFLPFAFLLVAVTLIVELAKGGVLFRWIPDGKTHDVILGHKAGYFYWPNHMGEFPAFFYLRAVMYGLVWLFITRKLIGLSKQQDQTGLSDCSAKARFTCAWTMPLFALSTAFAAFDWLMSVDYKFFSTMWGVYYFAGAAFSGSAVVALIFAVIHLKGKMVGAVTKEHFHDLGKLMFAFTVFWAYISFSQYFLIWYSNIPEETAFFVHRNNHGWKYLGIALMIGHFAIPFVMLVSRHVKKNPVLMIVMACWAVLIHCADIYWIVRPMVFPDGNGPNVAWIDFVALIGVLALFFGYIIHKVVSGPLLAINDPHMDEGLEHKNYV